MNLRENLLRLRTQSGKSQEKLAEETGVSRQTVQKWESGKALPDVENLISLARIFGCTTDELCGADNGNLKKYRCVDIRPQFSHCNPWETYGKNIAVEYKQCVQEGLDAAKYKNLFESVTAIPDDDIREDFADGIFKLISSLPTVAGYPYEEPSDYLSIKAASENPEIAEAEKPTAERIADGVKGGWYGRLAGNFAGKNIEGIRRKDLRILLEKNGNYPMRRFITYADYENVKNEINYPVNMSFCADHCHGVPDDDTNYTVIALKLLDDFGRDFRPEDVLETWMASVPKNMYCTAERTAYCNYIKGYLPPHTAIYKNAYREWIGAQIRGDFYGFINPGDPDSAAELAWKDASVSHVKNGIYGEMFVAAMNAAAYVTDDMREIVLSGIGRIPKRSRLHEAIMKIVGCFDDGKTYAEAFDIINSQFDENDSHDWCHTISNAMIVATALLFGKGDFDSSIHISVINGFDTDCNAATVGAILGVAFGAEKFPAKWLEPFLGKLPNYIPGYEFAKLDVLAEKTMKHIKDGSTVNKIRTD